MLSDAKFEFVKITLNNWESLGTPSVSRAGEQFGDLLAEIREAASGVTDATELASKIGDKIPDDMRKGVANIRKQAGPSPNELTKLKDQLEDQHAIVLQGMVDGHDVGLPKLSEPWTDEVFVAWMAQIPVMPEPFLTLMKDVKKWWNEVGNILT
ncbi:MAG: hypothetical protein K8I27_14225 [Planctomycetes bacterium]|nr:hypothetical protein [Planctomycetota bacterium]